MLRRSTWCFLYSLKHARVTPCRFNSEPVTKRSLLEQGNEIQELFKKPIEEGNFQQRAKEFRVESLENTELSNDILEIQPSFIDQCVGLYTEVHSAIGAPWWVTILLISLTVRVGLIPLSLIRLQNEQRKKFIQPQLDEAQEAMNLATSDTKVKCKKDFKELKEALYERAGVNTWKQILPAGASGIAFVIQYLSVRQMCDMPELQFKEGGPFWISDFTAWDPYYIFPALFYVLMVYRTYAMNVNSISSLQFKIFDLGRAASFGLLAAILSGRAAALSLLAVVTMLDMVAFEKFFQKNHFRIALGVPKLEASKDSNLIHQLKAFVEKTSEGSTKENDELYEKLRKEREKEDVEYENHLKRKLAAAQKEYDTVFAKEEPTKEKPPKPKRKTEAEIIQTTATDFPIFVKRKKKQTPKK